jgi:hypothetical protein
LDCESWKSKTTASAGMVAKCNPGYSWSEGMRIKYVFSTAAGPGDLWKKRFERRPSHLVRVDGPEIG